MDAPKTEYRSETRGIRVTVVPDFLEHESEPEADHYVWAYTVRIANASAAIVKLLNRRWHITDASGRTMIVKGDGVVGEQPVLGPGDAYEYTSGCPLSTPSGLMFGAYGMQTDTGEHFEVSIPAFALDSPHDWRRVN